MLNATIYLPLATGLIVLLLPKSKPALVRWTALSGAVLTLTAVLALWAGYDPAGATLQWRTTLPWIPAINAT